MRILSETIKAMVIFTEFGLRRLRWIIENLDEQVFDWKMNSQSNTIRWVLSHISLMCARNNPTLTHHQMLTDIKEGEKIVLARAVKPPK